MLRLLLPPNLPATAPRDAIGVKIEVDLSRPPPPEMLPALAALQRFGAVPAPVMFLQLTADQLRELTTLLKGQSVFAFVNAPAKTLLWVGPILRGVSEHLPKPEPKAATPTASAPSKSKIVNRKSEFEPDLSPMQVDGSEHFLAITLPSRESVAYGSALELLKDHGFRLEPSNRKWWLRDRHKTLSFLSRHLDTLESEFHADFTANFERNTAKILHAGVATKINKVGDEFEVTVGLDTGSVSGAALTSALTSNRGYLESGDKIFLIDPTQAAKIGAVQSALAGEPTALGGARQTHRVSAARAAEIDDLLEELSPGYKSPATWRQRSGALRDLSTLDSLAVPNPAGELLRPYQKLGVAWMGYLHQHKLGGILADEMGLGKTLQALALIAALRQEQIVNESATPTLVVAPASLVENWRREAAKFTPQLKVFVHHGAHRLDSSQVVPDHDLIITSYATLANDRGLFANSDWRCVIADEAQHIKNRRTRNAKALRALSAESRFLLTGTPLENSLNDLRSLFEFLLPGFLKEVPTGLRGDERTWHDDRLRSQTASYILRRTKETVAPELPEKIEQVIYCEQPAEQVALYRRTQESSERSLLELETKGANQGAIRMATLTQLLRLRQVCCDPRLVEPQALPGWSSKLAAFRELMDEIVDEGHRVLVFSQFTSLLALLREELDSSGIGYAYLDGSMNPTKRQAAVDHFQNDDQVPVFLLSLKAGGTGLNLTGADTVIHFDPWWNPAVEAQATDRAHRIGQTRVVTSYKLICAGSVEEKVLGLQETKRALLADVFEASDAVSAKLELSDLRELLT
ncbi:MAG: DEAD/DEAH box helicase [Opitutaceae bacterium]|jgi:SNF2 family DNA or RNA helicase|nr:DEAD/DEAH box helicase [Opitutaceae bacterium]